MWISLPGEDSVSSSLLLYWALVAVPHIAGDKACWLWVWGWAWGLAASAL